MAFLIALGMVGALVWFFVDYRFFVYAIDVDGAEMVSKEDVLQAAGVYEMSVFYVNRGKAAEQVRDKLLAVESVSVRCGLPAIVRVGVREKAIAYRWLSGGQTYLVDEEGLVLGPDDGLHQDVTVIQDQDGGPLSAGDRVNEDAMQTVAQLAGLLPEMTTFQYSNAMGVSLIGDRGLTVHFGDDRGLPAKVANMKAMLRELADGGQTAQFIDVRFAGSPYYR